MFLNFLLLISVISVKSAFVPEAPGSFAVNPVFTNCLSTDDWASDPNDNTRFYRCAHGFQYSLRCGPGEIYFGNGDCNYPYAHPERTTVEITTTEIPTTTVVASTTVELTTTTEIPTETTTILTTTTIAIAKKTSTTSLCSSGCPFSFLDSFQQVSFCNNNDFGVIYSCCCNEANSKKKPSYKKFKLSLTPFKL